MYALLLYFTRSGNFIALLFLIVTGIVYLFFAQGNEDPYSKKGLFAVLGVFNIFFNFISGILVLISLDKRLVIDENNLNIQKNKEKEKIDPEKKKIDILLKLGVGMVTISGLIFATNSWDSVPNIIKFIFLIILSLVFFALYYFCEYKLELKRSAFVYYMLGNIFIIFSYISVGYFALIGPWFSIDGAGSDIFKSFLFILIALITTLIYRKYSKEFYLYFIYFALQLTLVYFFNFLEVSQEVIMLVLTLIIALTNGLKFENNIETEIYKKFNIIMTYLLGAIFIILVNDMRLDYATILIAIVLLFEVFYILKNAANSFTEFSSAILVSLIPLSTIMGLKITSNLEYVIVGGACSIIYILCFVFHEKNNKNLFIKVVSITQNIILLTFILNSFSEELTFETGIIALSALITNIVYGVLYKNSDVNIVEKYLQALKILIMNFTIMYIINEHFLAIGLDWGIIITSILLLGLYFLFKDERKKKEYFIGFVISSVITSMICLDTQNRTTLIMALLLSAVPFIINYFKTNSNDKLNVLSYIYLLFMIFIIINENNLFIASNLFSSLIVLGIFVILAIILRKDSTLLNITQFGAIIPFQTMLNATYIEKEILTVLNASFYLYLTFILCNNIVKGEKAKNIFSSICLSLIMLTIIFDSGWLVGFYIGIVALLAIIIGYSVKEYKSLFITGIIITIVNILYQFHNLLKVIPFWLYLLIGGLGIIAFVMYKEIKKK